MRASWGSHCRATWASRNRVALIRFGPACVMGKPLAWASPLWLADGCHASPLAEARNVREAVDGVNEGHVDGGTGFTPIHRAKSRGRWDRVADRAAASPSWSNVFCSCSACACCGEFAPDGGRQGRIVHPGLGVTKSCVSALGPLRPRVGAKRPSSSWTGSSLAPGGVQVVAASSNDGPRVVPFRCAPTGVPVPGQGD